MINREQHLENFANERPEQFAAAKDLTIGINSGAKVICCVAPVKSGKKQIAQILSLMYAKQNRSFFFVTSLNRKDIHAQHEENENQYGLDTFVLDSKSKVQELIDKLNQSKDPIILFDELDYGSGRGQNFEPVFKNCQSKNYPIIGFSATPEELLFSNKSDYITFFIPHPNYRGIEWFYKNNLCFDAKPFCENGRLSQQGAELLDELVSSTKPIGVVRFAGKGSNEDISILKDMIESQYKKQITFVQVSEKHPFKWDNDPKADWRKFVGSSAANPKTIIVIKQTSTRSTEWAFQEHVLFFHDFRKSNEKYKSKQTACNTIAQSILRPAHYHDIGHKVKLYADYTVLEILAKSENLIKKAHQNLTDNQSLSGNDRKKLIEQLNSLFNDTGRPASSRTENVAKHEDYDFYHVYSNDISLDNMNILSKNTEKNDQYKIDKFIWVVDEIRKLGYDFWNILFSQINRAKVINGDVNVDKYLPFYNYSGILKPNGSPPKKINEIILDDSLSDRDKIKKLKDKKESLSAKAIGISDLIGFQYSKNQKQNLFKAALDRSRGTSGGFITVNIYNGVDPRHPEHQKDKEDLEKEFPGIYASILIPKDRAQKIAPNDDSIYAEVTV